MRRAALLALVVLACSRPPAAAPAKPGATVIQGHVFDAAGKPFRMAHVDRKLVAPDGSFSLSRSNDTRAFKVIPVSAPEHRHELVGYELDESGFEYRTQIVIDGGTARITLDPRTLSASDTSIDVAPPDSRSAALTATELRLSQTRKRLSSLIHASVEDDPQHWMERFDQAEKAEWAAVRCAATSPDEPLRPRRRSFGNSPR